MNKGEIKILVNNPVVVAMRGDKKGIARCCPEDVFDLSVCVKLAVERLEEQEKFIPNSFEMYWYVTQYNQAYSTHYMKGALIDDINLSYGNCFRTSEEALANFEKIDGRIEKIIAYAKELAEND